MGSRNHALVDYHACLQDEIALEGLDGITLEALWKRLEKRNNFLEYLILDDDSKKFLYSFIVQDEEVEFYCLKESRPPLKIFNRYEYIDNELGIIYEPKDDCEDIYPCVPIDDTAAGIRGSCSTYETRINITEEVISLSLKEATNKYGNKLVLVGSQVIRNKALSINAAIDKLYDLKLMQYVMLERIGRSRTMGEITYGKNSLAVMNVPPKSLFYYRKRLLKLNLITKQSHRQRSAKGNISSSSLLHLTRFYVVRRPKFLVMIHQVVEILKNKPDNIYPVENIKEEVGLQNMGGKKIFKCSDFAKFIQTVLVPYRQIHKEAKVEEWKYKSKNEEKMIRCLKLINPHMNIEDLFMVEDDDDELDEFESLPGILNQSNLLWGKNMLKQAYSLIESAGPNGLSQIELSKQLGLTKLDSRTICRNLQKRNVIFSLMKDIGRQRVTRFVSNKFANTGHFLQEFEKERKKMIELVGESAPSKPQQERKETIQYQSSTPSTSRIMESDVVGDIEIGLEMTHSGSKTSATVSEESDPLAIPNPGTVGSESSCMVIRLSDSIDDSNSSSSVRSDNCHSAYKKAFINLSRTSPQVTTRMIKRANIIMKEVRKHKVIDDTFKLQKLIVNTEEAEGVEGKMDKKSLTRLLDRLSRAGFVKKIQVKIQAESKTKTSTFVVDPSITLENNLLKMAIEQQKHKFLVQASSSLPKHVTEMKSTFEKHNMSSEGNVSSSANEKKDEDHSVGASVIELEKMHMSSIAASNKNIKTNSTETKVVGIKGNCGPKFVRMQEFHKLLFYLVYGYEGQTDLDQVETWSKVVQSSSQDISGESMQDYPTVYVPEVSWKMFIPPLPEHPTVTVDGWVFVVDVLLRLPLCIFCQLVNLATCPSMLPSYLNHPIKQNLLVKSLPPELRRPLFNGRRYVTYVMELCRRLCYVGLLQLGEQLMKEKDQIFVYLNRKATLVDTTTSNPGYHQISLDREYVRKEYYFYTLQDVIQYWYDMWTICMHTPLGVHTCVEGDKITIQVLTKKPEMIESLETRGIEEAAIRDNGTIPGDEKGAAGLDSAMFSHLKRNWSCLYPKFSALSANSQSANSGGDKGASGGDKTFSYAQYLRDSCSPGSVDSSVSKNKLAGLRNVRLSLYKPKGEKEIGKAVPVSVGMVESVKKRKKRSEKAKESSTKIVRKSKVHNITGSFQREIKARLKPPKKPYYDEEDKAALRRMNKLRVDWYPAEDALLLLCKVSSEYLFPNKRTQVINFSVVRDLLHSRYPESRNKTSRACQRRINYILKNPATEENVAVILEELKQDEEITKDFKPAKLNYTLTMLHKLYVNSFKELVSRLVTKYASNESKDVQDIPDSYEEFENNFKIIRASKSLREGPKVKEVSSVHDIDQYVVNALIFSSLCTKQDRESWAYQLYLAYQKYPQKLLNTVLNSIRERKMISYKKCYNKSRYIRNCLPLSTSPFQLSLSFIYLFHMKYQYEMFGECWEVMKRLLEDKRSAMLQNSTLKNPDLDGNEQDTENLGTENSASTKTSTPKAKRKRRAPRVGSKMETSKATRKAKALERKKARLMKERLKSLPTTENVNEGLDESLKANEESREAEIPGLKISVNVEGGCCAAISSLAALGRISFNVNIPEQMIVVDHVQEENLERQHRLLKVIKNHEIISGRKFILPKALHKSGLSGDEDIYADNQEEDYSAMELDDDFGDESIDSSPKHQRIPFSDQQTLTNLDKESQNACENSDSLKRKFSTMDSESDDDARNSKKLKPGFASENSLDNSLGGDKNADGECSQRRMKTQSRVRMYMMREQLPGTGLSRSPAAMDNFFINTCNVTCRVAFPPGVEKPSVFSSFNEVSRLIMPISEEVITEALNMRKRVVVQSWNTLEGAVQDWREEGRSSQFIENVQNLYEFIDSKREVGATAKEIKNAFIGDQVEDDHPMKVLREMEGCNLVLKVGVETFRWVTMPHSKVWLIRTNKIARGKMNSSEPFRLSGVYDVKGADDADDSAAASNSPKKSATAESTENKEDAGLTKGNEPQTENVEEEEQSSSGDVGTKSTTTTTTTTTRKPKITLLKKKTRKDFEVAENMEKSADQHQNTAQYEEIDVLVRPWVRLNGCLNRRVMDRMLGSVLCFVMENPGVKGFQITERFWPGLQPAHTYELLETLLVLGAVEKSRIRVEPVSLFDGRQQISRETCSDYDFDDDMIYEATVDAIVKLSSFIGDKKYTQDFLNMCR